MCYSRLYLKKSFNSVTSYFCETPNTCVVHKFSSQTAAEATLQVILLTSPSSDPSKGGQPYGPSYTRGSSVPPLRKCSIRLHQIISRQLIVIKDYAPLLRTCPVCSRHRRHRVRLCSLMGCGGCVT